jgi:hypothetical protein
VDAVPARLEGLVDSLFPGARVDRIAQIGPDGGSGADAKVAAASDAKMQGYGVPVRITARLHDGSARDLVFRTMAPNPFGHDRRADRADGLVLAYDQFGRTPDHVRALDVGAIAADGRCVSLRDTGEFYLLTEWADGVPYSEDLRRIARDGIARPIDRARAAALARWLAALHAPRFDDPDRWHRAVRDLLGHGEGIFGMVDGYPSDTPAAPPARLRAIEERCLAWRWRLREKRRRLAPTHGDFHPFNVLFPPGADGDSVGFRLLDASRGGVGDPADDLTAMAINYVFFAVGRREAWARGLGPLWRLFLETYLAAARDEEVHETAPPFLAWRGLVVAAPRFYPNLSAEARDAVLSFVERVLDRGFLAVEDADEVLGRSEP